MCAAIIYMILLECGIQMTLNLMIYQKLILRIILQLVLLKINKILKFAQLLMLPMKVFKLELKVQMVVEIMN